MIIAQKQGSFKGFVKILMEISNLLCPAVRSGTDDYCIIPHKDSIDITDLNVVESPRFEYRAIRDSGYGYILK